MVSFDKTRLKSVHILKIFFDGSSSFDEVDLTVVLDDDLETELILFMLTVLDLVEEAL